MEMNVRHDLTKSDKLEHYSVNIIKLIFLILVVVKVQIFKLFFCLFFL